MKDRYLFRGQCHRTGDWKIGTMQYINDERQEIYINTRCIDPKTIGQCTGLRDKNDNLIFEGDILSYAAVDSRTGSIYKGHTMGVVEYHDHHLTFWLSSAGSLAESLEFSAYKVIGNIHDNPELLESEV